MSAVPGARRRLAGLDEARARPDGVVVLVADHGGTILLVAPAGGVRCAEETLLRLLVDLDELSCPEDEMQGCGIRYLEAPVGTALGVPLPGTVTGDLWLHPGLVQAGLGPAVRAVLAGERRRVPPVEPPVDPVARAAILRAHRARAAGHGVAFGWDRPEEWRHLPWDEVERRMAAEIPPRADGERWWPQTLRAAAQQAGLRPWPGTYRGADDRWTDPFPT